MNKSSGKGPLGRSDCYSKDTEHVKHDALLTFPFASHVVTPSCFWKKLGKKHIRYFSYNELAYLQQKYFTPDETILEQMDVRKGERFVVMRFVYRGFGEYQGYALFGALTGLGLFVRYMLFRQARKGNQ